MKPRCYQHVWAAGDYKCPQCQKPICAKCLVWKTVRVHRQHSTQIYALGSSLSESVVTYETVREEQRLFCKNCAGKAVSDVFIADPPSPGIGPEPVPPPFALEGIPTLSAKELKELLNKVTFGVSKSSAMGTVPAPWESPAAGSLKQPVEKHPPKPKPPRRTALEEDVMRFLQEHDDA